MEMQVTIKTKLKISNSEIALSFSKTMEQYRQACNYVSEYIFNHDFDMKQSRLNKELYTKLRNLFSLKSQMAQSVIRTVIARYKTVKTQMARKPYKYQDQNTGEWYREVRDLTWLHKPISFN
ncbi:transposase, partial [Ligilactobacillus salivarius]|nr:transposase [Ligilactobacillus salivarius]